jgi:hypothetical protein
MVRLFARAVPATIVLALVAVQASAAAAQLRSNIPERLTDAQFWEFFTTMSEPGGTFLSENFVSNEVTFQHVIPTLQRTLTPGGVYLGVGPEQNFTYIANLKPGMAVIFDIRRQNAMAHLMYKALFELSPTRADFIARLFSRPQRNRFAPTVSVTTLFEAATMAPSSDSAFRANRDAIVENLRVRHNFSLTPADLASIDRVFTAFYQAGPLINYAYRPAGSVMNRSGYASYATLQTATNADTVQMAFLATEESYRWLRNLHARNLVIPVVGDFAGPTAIRAVGEYLRQRNATVTAFYLSNVEQYLFESTANSEAFYRNVATLPIDSTSSFIRSVPPGGTFTRVASPGGVVTPPGARGYYSFTTTFDSVGMRFTRTTTDSAGRPVTRTAPMLVNGGQVVYSSETPGRARARADTMRVQVRGQIAVLDSVSRALTMPTSRLAYLPAVVTGGVLVSGVAGILTTLDAFAAGRLGTYPAAVAMTKTSGWR